MLITGTNGKGSTAVFLDGILRAAGYRTGCFTSPHLVDVSERIVIDGRPIDATTFTRLAGEVRDAMAAGARPVRATYFEALTAIGFLAFARAGIDLAVVEVGMGGRYDSTNVCDPRVSVLTNVTLDHTAFLGPTADAIAAEKVGVARPGRMFITAVEDGVFERVVGPALDAIGAPARRLGREVTVARRADGRIDWSGARRSLEGVPVGLPGTFQVENAALALAAAEALAETDLPVDDTAMRSGIAGASWPGRMQRVHQRPTVILDGCHNPGAAIRLAETLQADPPARPLVLVHGSRPDKDVASVLATLVPCVDAVVETGIPGLAAPEGLAPLAQAGGRGKVPVKVVPDLGQAISRAMAMAGPTGTVLVTGSLYLVGAALASQPWS